MKYRVNVVIPSAVVVTAKNKEEALRKAWAMSTQQRLKALEGVSDVEITATEEDIEEINGRG